jgi:hypothetical protein
MTIKSIYENPSISDQIVISIDAPGADGCFSVDPYMIDNVKIYYIERKFSGNDVTAKNPIYDQQVKNKLDAAIANACQNPSSSNLLLVDQLTVELNKTIKIQTVYFDNALPVKIIGSQQNPAWISTEPDNTDLIHLETNESGVPQYGKFQYQWSPVGMREGDYLWCYTWTPNVSGDKLSASTYFYLKGDTAITTVPIHHTNPKKYSTLLDRYLPEIFKSKISSADLAPNIIKGMNDSVADGFTFLEDMSNQIIDGLDANVVPEAFLNYLAANFGLNLYSQDPTLWRRQIKNAIPLLKKKGTLGGLKTALSQAGMNLTRFSQMWEVKSKYTYQEEFIYSGNLTFTLSKIAITDNSNLEIYYRSAESETWQNLNSNYVTFGVDSGKSIITWIGQTLMSGSIILQLNDSIRLIYKTASIPNSNQQNIESYIRTLPLMDDRDEREQQYPPKDWNTRLIEEDDPLFSLVVPDRNPFFDPIMYGWTRTEFAYSENVYNMEEYNGSVRESFNPCDIDKNFLDPCFACMSSKYVLDLEIEGLSNDKIIEAQKIITDYTPFHSVLHSINLTGKINEFILSPIERISQNMRYAHKDFIISGDAQNVFNRLMYNSDQIKRNELANATTVGSNTGLLKNTTIVLYAPNVNLNDQGLDKNSIYTLLEVLAPSSNAGNYHLKNPDGNIAEYDQSNIINAVTEPLDDSAFTFRLSNIRLTKTSTTIHQDDYFLFSDPNLSLETELIYTLKEGSNAWKIVIPAYSTEYKIADILPNGSLVLVDLTKTLPTSNTSGISYSLVNYSNITVLNSTSGKLNVTRRGRVSLAGTVSIRGSNVTFSSVQSLFDKYQDGWKTHYLLYNGVQYLISGLSGTSEFYISGYTSGDVSGASIKLYQRLYDNKTGYFGYQGMKLTTPINYETTLGIYNGANPSSTPLEESNFKENYLLLINTEYYSMQEIDGTEITLNGPLFDWKTTGTSVTYTLLHYETLGASISESDVEPFHNAYDFDRIDRRGGTPIKITTPNNPAITALMANAMNLDDGRRLEVISQQENITFTIEMVE